MTLAEVEIEDFQSLASVRVPIGGFTVIVGASNSGKSAFLRAIRTVAYNASSPSFVREGSKTAFMRLDLDKTEVTLERGRSVSTYAVGEEVYAKAGTSVPKAVADVLGFVETEGEPLNFAFQFDRPYLVADTGSKVAKVLGDLTNITLVYDAVREVNRRRLEALAKRKIRIADAEKVSERLESYRGLNARKEALGVLRGRYEALVGSQDEVAQVRERVEVVRLAERVISRVVPAAVGLSRLDERVAEYVALVRVKSSVSDSEERLDRAESALIAASVDQGTAMGAYQGYLDEVGVCPVCGREM